MTPFDASRLHADLVSRGVIKPPPESAGLANDNDFDPIADAWGSVHFAYDVIRKRMASGGPGWEPKP